MRMLNGPMTLLTTVGDAFHGRVLVALLGAEGIVSEMKGAVDSTYPLRGEVELWVEAGNWDTAWEILSADDPVTLRHEDATGEERQLPSRSRTRKAPTLLLVAVLGMLVLTASLRFFVAL